jgi:hypothetical protein
MHTPLPMDFKDVLEILEEARDYFEDRADCDAGRPNLEMRLQCQLEDVKMYLQKSAGLPVDQRGNY